MSIRAIVFTIAGVATLAACGTGRCDPRAELAANEIRNGISETAKPLFQKRAFENIAARAERVRELLPEGVDRRIVAAALKVGRQHAQNGEWKLATAPIRGAFLSLTRARGGVKAVPGLMFHWYQAAGGFLTREWMYAVGSNEHFWDSYPVIRDRIDGPLDRRVVEWPLRKPWDQEMNALVATLQEKKGGALQAELCAQIWQVSASVLQGVDPALDKEIADIDERYAAWAPGMADAGRVRDLFGALWSKNRE